MDAVGPIVQLFNTLWECCAPDLSYLQDFPRKVQKLNDLVEDLKALREDVSTGIEKGRRQSTVQAQRWLQRADSIIGFADTTIAEGRAIGEEDERSCPCFGNCCLNFSSRYQTGKAIVEATETVKCHKEGCKDLKVFHSFAKPEVEITVPAAQETTVGHGGKTDTPVEVPTRLPSRKPPEKLAAPAWAVSYSHGEEASRPVEGPTFSPSTTTSAGSSKPAVEVLPHLTPTAAQPTALAHGGKTDSSVEGAPTRLLSRKPTEKPAAPARAVNHGEESIRPVEVPTFSPPTKSAASSKPAVEVPALLRPTKPAAEPTAAAHGGKTDSSVEAASTRLLSRKPTEKPAAPAWADSHGEESKRPVEVPTFPPPTKWAARPESSATAFRHRGQEEKPVGQAPTRLPSAQFATASKENGEASVDLPRVPSHKRTPETHASISRHEEGEAFKPSSSTSFRDTAGLPAAGKPTRAGFFDCDEAAAHRTTGEAPSDRNGSSNGDQNVDRRRW